MLGKCIGSNDPFLFSIFMAWHGSAPQTFVWLDVPICLTPSTEKVEFERNIHTNDGINLCPEIRPIKKNEWLTDGHVWSEYRAIDWAAKKLYLFQVAWRNCNELTKMNSCRGPLVIFSMYYVENAIQNEADGPQMISNWPNTSPKSSFIALDHLKKISFFIHLGMIMIIILRSK